jgi:hypothetical protein
VLPTCQGLISTARIQVVRSASCFLCKRITCRVAGEMEYKKNQRNCEWDDRAMLGLLSKHNNSSAWR